MSYTPSTNKDYLRRIQYAPSPMNDPTFANIGFVSRFNTSLTNDQEVIRELGFEDIGYDLKLGEVVAADLTWRAVDPALMQWFTKLADGNSGTPSEPIAILENCNINGASRFFITDSLKPTRFSLTYARMLELSGNMVGITQTDAMTETALEILIGSGVGLTNYAPNITTPPWSNLSGETTDPVTIDTGSGFDPYPNISLTLDVGRAVANNQPSGNTAPTHIDVTNRDITGNWTTILKDDPFYTHVKNGTPVDIKVVLKAGATPCVLDIVDAVFSSVARTSDAGSTSHRQITYPYRAKSMSISDYVAA